METHRPRVQEELGEGVRPLRVGVCREAGEA